MKSWQPKQGTRPLGPGESEWVQLGGADEFGTGALSVSAIPVHGTGGKQHVMKVENVNITQIETVQGDLTFSEYFAGCSVVNNGETTIEQWIVVFGVIVPTT